MNTLVSSGRALKFAGSQHGLVVVELAITLPLVILIMFATVEFGRGFYQYTTLTKAVQAGTRYYASDKTIPTAVIKNLVVTASPDGSKPAVLSGFVIGNVDVEEDGDHIVVSATYRFVPFLGGKLPIFGEITDFPMTVSHSQRVL